MKKIVVLYLLSAVLMFFSGCKNDIETIHALTSEKELPDVTGFQVEMQYTDSGYLKGKIIAPEVLQYNKVEDPYNEFPKGMTAVFFDRNGNETSFIKADYAIYYTKKQLWEGRKQVYGENRVTGERIETDQIFWDQSEKRIYSEKYTKITRPDGTHIGEYGFDAEEDLSPIQLRGYSGKVTIKDEPAEEN
ncbi:MAG TPA: LPS export ABC transporter periplasmic protein LptC [Bacteroidales bacterium]|nr:LPS export ABC transporter periplasmic protein LptC [Bacteroidales bacterium]